MEFLYLFFGFCIAMSVLGVVGDYFKQKAKMSALEKKVDSSEKVKLDEEITSIKHRLVVLEKIVTDKGYQLEEEIEKLKSIK